MADYVWPPSLPQEPWGNGDATYTPADNFIRPSMETGSSKSRQRWTAVTDAVQITLWVTMSQLATLKGFRKTVGAKAFEWIDFDTMLVGTYVFTSGITRRFIGVDDSTGEFCYEASFGLELQP